MNREQMVDRAAEAILRDRRIYGLPGTDYAAADACAAINAVLPQVTTVAELEALPFAAKVVDRYGNVWWRRTKFKWTDTDFGYLEGPEYPSSRGPLTVVWQPEVTA